ncbi:unnamed protein product [Symbiodinium microadriaticum]|nr:unnamed protein product [Symbiodinium microadriaticum]
MPSTSLTKAQMQSKLAEMGETPPPGWTKVQLSARIAELTSESEQILTEREASKMINRCKTKLALQELLDEYHLEYTRGQTMDQLRGRALRHLMETKVPSSPQNYMGFGKYSSLTYGQVATNYESYTEWCIKTAREEEEAHWRLRRFAQWAQRLSKSEKEALSRFRENAIEEEMNAWMGHRQTGYSRSYKPKTASSASSSETADSKWEMMSVDRPDHWTDNELIPENKMGSEKKIEALEEEVHQLKEMVKAQLAESEHARKHSKAKAVFGEGSVLRLSHWNGGDLGTASGPQNQCFAAEEAPGLGPPSGDPDDLKDIPADARKRSIQTVKAMMSALVAERPSMPTQFGEDAKSMYVAEKAFLEEQAKDVAQVVEECGFVFPEEDNGFWHRKEAAVSLSVELPKDAMDIDLEGDEFGPEREMMCEPLPEICEALGIPPKSTMLLTKAAYGLVEVAPQLSAPTGLLLSRIHSGTVTEIIETNKLLRKAKLNQHQKLLIHRQEDGEPLLAAWADAAHANRNDGGSTKGIFIGWTSRRLLQGDLVDISPIFWQSAKAHRTCRSSAAAETLSAVDAEDELYAIRLQVSEFRGDVVSLWSCDESVKTVDGVLITDSKNLYDRLNRTVMTFRGEEKRSDIESMCLKESMNCTSLNIRWVNGDSQLADSLTKESEPHQICEYHRRRGQWRIVYDPELISGRKRKQQGLDRLETKVAE